MINLNFFQQRAGEHIEIMARNFVDKMKRFSLKRRPDNNDFENDLETFFLPVNESVDEVASALSESLNK